MAKRRTHVVNSGSSNKKVKKPVRMAQVVGRMPIADVLLMRGYGAAHGTVGYNRRKEKESLRKEARYA